jgi:hypothetical protein
LRRYPVSNITEICWGVSPSVHALPIQCRRRCHRITAIQTWKPLYNTGLQIICRSSGRMKHASPPTKAVDPCIRLKKSGDRKAGQLWVMKQGHASNSTVRPATCAAFFKSSKETNQQEREKRSAPTDTCFNPELMKRRDRLLRSYKIRNKLVAQCILGKNPRTTHGNLLNRSTNFTSI